MRAIALIGLLAIKPCSMEDIRNYFLDYGLIDSDQPDDIIRIDLNTIKGIGCTVSRSSKSTGYKYVLTEHPFKLNLTEDNVKILKKAYNKLKADLDIPKLLEYDELFRKLADNVNNSDIKEQLLGISILKHYNYEQIKKLYKEQIQKATVTISYKKPTSSKEIQKTIVIQKLGYSSGKIYLYGYDTDNKVQTMLNCMHITKILSKQYEARPEQQREMIKVNFKLKLTDEDLLSENEIVTESNENEVFVEGSYYNDFLAIQRVLSFGSRCTVIEPAEIRNKVIEKLLEMRRLYETGR